MGDGVAHQQLSMPIARLLLFIVSTVWEHGLLVDVMVNNRGLLLSQGTQVAEGMLAHQRHNMLIARLRDVSTEAVTQVSTLANAFLDT